MPNKDQDQRHNQQQQTQKDGNRDAKSGSQRDNKDSRTSGNPQGPKR